MLEWMVSSHDLNKESRSNHKYLYIRKQASGTRPLILKGWLINRAVGVFIFHPYLYISWSHRCYPHNQIRHCKFLKWECIYCFHTQKNEMDKLNLIRLIEKNRLYMILFDMLRFYNQLWSGNENKCTPHYYQSNLQIHPCNRRNRYFHCKQDYSIHIFGWSIGNGLAGTVLQKFVNCFQVCYIIFYEIVN